MYKMVILNKLVVVVVVVSHPSVSKFKTEIKVFFAILSPRLCAPKILRCNHYGKNEAK